MNEKYCSCCGKKVYFQFENNEDFLRREYPVKVICESCYLSSVAAQAVAQCSSQDLKSWLKLYDINLD